MLIKSHYVWAGRRTRQSQVPTLPTSASPHRFRLDILHLPRRQVRPRHSRTVNKILVQRIDRNRSVLLHAQKLPIAKSNFTVVTAAYRGRRSALLLRSIDPVRKAIVGSHMIELRRRLVVPTAPRRAAIHADHRALI